MRCFYTLSYLIISLVTLLFPTHAFSDNNAKKQKGNLPETIENALTALLDASAPQAPLPSHTTLDTILQFILSSAQSKQTIQPKIRDYGLGIFYTDTIHVPLSVLMEYTLNTNIPGESIYPTSIRRNTWINNHELIAKHKEFLNPTKPEEPIFAKGIEYEEITPDISSGCYYSYSLNRLFILYSYKNNPVLFSIAFMPQESSVGLRGGVVGDDNKWMYIYTPTVGTNISMLSWAKTYMYGSATISIYFQQPKSNATTLYIFKWTKAGSSSMNVVKHKHITDGVIRFVKGFKQVIESPNRPSVQDITKKHNELKSKALSELQTDLTPFAKELEIQSSKISEFSSKTFQNVLKNGVYPTTMNKDNIISELIKLYVKEQVQPQK